MTLKSDSTSFISKHFSTICWGTAEVCFLAHPA